MRILLTSLTLVLASGTLLAADGLEEIKLNKVDRVEVYPSQYELTGVRQRLQLVVTVHHRNGLLQDVTRIAKFASSDPQVAEVVGSQVQTRGNGEATITVRAGGKRTQMNIKVSGQDQPEPVSFQYETLAALCKQGCNAGACHGSPSGKGGFRMSLRAFDSTVDGRWCPLPIIPIPYSFFTDSFYL